jgi:hypothetical protein
MSFETKEHERKGFEKFEENSLTAWFNHQQLHKNKVLL